MQVFNVAQTSFNQFIFAARQGFEPRFLVPETNVLPLDDQASLGSVPESSKKQKTPEGVFYLLNLNLIILKVFLNR